MKINMLSDELIKFVRKQFCLYKYHVTAETDLIIDLRMDGDEGFDFILLYAKTFRVDITLLSADKYFMAEGFQFFSGLFEKIGISKNKRKTLLVGDLQKGIESGFLNDQIIEARLVK